MIDSFGLIRLDRCNHGSLDNPGMNEKYKGTLSSIGLYINKRSLDVFLIQLSSLFLHRF